jgi:ergothioneine biosynthesis protein EgtB
MELPPSEARSELLERFARVREFSEALTAPLAPEDTVLQAMDDVSPTKWHLAHTTWFFERFILADLLPGYEPHDPQYDFLFNSYYNSIGPMHPRPERGLLSRPTLGEVRAYRAEIDSRMGDFLITCAGSELERAAPLVELGCHHEQQHQELIVTDLKFNWFQNPLLPGLATARRRVAGGAAPELRFVAGEHGVREIGAAGGFHFDNEGPRHRTVVEPHALASRPVTNGEFVAFVEDGGYERPELWLDAGFATVRERGWRHPLYWIPDAGGFRQYTLAGPAPLDPAEPVVHLCYFEADAYARWAGYRLPTEAEWEGAAASHPVAGHFADEGELHPRPSPGAAPLQQLYGDVWEWTASPYVGYPGYRPLAGAVGEYNGKFMCNQLVLRGGSCATPAGHVRATYRNFFPADARWQFSGVRLAADA